MGRCKVLRSSKDLNRVGRTARAHSYPLCLGKRVFAVGFVMTCFATNVYAQGPSYVPPRADPQTEFRVSFEALQQNPTDTSAIWRFVAAATEIGDYEAAIGVLEPLLLVDSSQQVIRSEVGLLYYLLGSYAAAEPHLRQALDSGKLSPKRESLVRRALSTTQKRNRRNSLTGSVTLGARHQSNPTAFPESDSATVGGTDIALADEFVRDSDTNAFASGWLHHKFDLDWQNEAAFDTRIYAYATRQFEATETNVLTATIEPGFSFRPLRKTAHWLELRPHLVGNALSIEDQLYALTYGVGADLGADFESGIKVNVRYQFRERDFRSSAERPLADDLDGNEHHYKLSIGAPLPSNFTIVAKGYVIATNADAERRDNINYLISGALYKDYKAPLGIGSTNWRAWIRLDREYRNFDNVDPVISTTIKREDRRWIVSAGNTANIFEQIDLNIEYTYYDQSSAFRQYEYSNHTGTLSLSYLF